MSGAEPRFFRWREGRGEGFLSVRRMQEVLLGCKGEGKEKEGRGKGKGRGGPKRRGRHGKKETENVLSINIVHFPFKCYNALIINETERYVL